MAKTITIRARVAELVKQHGGLRIAARALKIDHGYLSRLANGLKDDPGANIEYRLGLRRVITYVRRADGGSVANLGQKLRDAGYAEVPDTGRKPR